MRTAVLDACVLYPTVLREILADVAGQGLYRPVWTPRIIAEWIHAADRLGAEGGSVARAEAALLQIRFPQAGIEADEKIAIGLNLPDPADAHVIAAAMVSGAPQIVTANLRDFPRHALPGIEAIHPDAFLTALWASDPDPVESAVASAHKKASDLGIGMEVKPLLKRARLPRLARAITRSQD